MENLNIYNAFKAVPKEAQKEIKGGRLAGMTDINPVWRIKMLTEQFGPCGRGWYTEIKDRWTETYGQEVACFVRIALYVKFPETKEWSAPIEGVGGSKLAAIESKGVYFTDEAYKMAYTDAISVACKALGMAADVYFAKGAKLDTKYDRQEPAAQPRLTKLPPAEYQQTEGTAYKPMDEDTYWKFVACKAQGKLTKSGLDAERKWTMLTHAGAAETAKFRHDVENYCAARQMASPYQQQN